MMNTPPSTPAYNYLPAKLLPKIPRIGATAEHSDPTAWIKLFTPDAGWTWYIVEYDAEDDLCFGLVHGMETELGSFSLAELREIRGALNLPIERDLYFDPRPLSKCERR